MMLEQIIEDCYPVLNELGKSINFNTEENIMLMADSDKLSRVFNNLIKKALNYSKEESEIIISVKKEENNVSVEVKNVGNQISQEILYEIFVKFYRLDSSRDSNTEVVDQAWLLQKIQQNCIMEQLLLKVIKIKQLLKLYYLFLEVKIYLRFL